MSGDGDLSNKMSQKTTLFGLKLWVLVGISVSLFIFLILFALSLWLISRKKLKMLAAEKLQCQSISSSSIPSHSKEIKEVKVDKVVPSSDGGVILTITDNRGNGEPEKVLVRVGISKKAGGNGDKSICTEVIEKNSMVQESSSSHLIQHSGFSIDHQQEDVCSTSGTGDGVYHPGESSGELALSEELHLGWGHWFTLRDLQIATNGFSSENVLGEGGYGIVYKGKLANGTMVAVKSLLNNMGQAEREFRVEVEAIGRVRHKNLVRFLGYCIEGTHRMLVYEYVDNGNLEQWLHGSLGCLTWENRMKIIIGTAKALAYLHEALEPKVVHRDIKASNILIDQQWIAKVSDFGLAKLLGAGKSHVTTRVMGTFGYVAPEYASTGLLNERSDVYSFGVLVLETITGRDPVDYSRPSGEVNLLDWLKVMVGNRRSEEVLDPKLTDKPAPRVLKKVLLIALRCVDPESEKRPRMGHVVHMLESEEFPYRDAKSLLTSKT